MPCYKPLNAYKSHVPKSNGKSSISFRPSLGRELIHLPCGQCIGCRLERSRQWAMRGVHEKQFHEESMFLTLTISPEKMKERNHEGLDKRELQLFMKRLRKHIWKVTNGKTKIRFMGCGEYGDLKSRPHYHLIIFGYDFPDKKIWKYSKNSRFQKEDLRFSLYRSKELEKLWTMGYSSIGEVTFETIAYVARYIMKKQNGKKEDVYINRRTGEIKEKEYIVTSRRPGIGKWWLDKYESDIYPKDWVTVRGKKMKPPRYYDKILETIKPNEYKDIKERRRNENIKKDNKDFKKPIDQRAPSLDSQRVVREKEQQNIKRSYEDET